MAINQYSTRIKDAVIAIRHSGSNQLLARPPQIYYVRFQTMVKSAALVADLITAQSLTISREAVQASDLEIVKTCIKLPLA